MNIYGRNVWMYRIGVVTGTRAEYGLLKPLMQKIRNDDLLELYCIVTGAHLEERFGYTFREIEQDGFCIDKKIPMELSRDTPDEICHSMGREMHGMAEAFRDARLDLLVLLGDRYEILVCALAAVIFNIPVAHLHGGEITEGAIDDAMRHAITKMSYLHFSSTEEYARRIIQMGEHPKRVHHVGAIGTETIRRMHFMTRKELAAQFTDLFLTKYIMVTYHPVTLDGRPVRGQVQSLLDVISERPEYNYIFTYANADRDGMVINQMLDAYAKKNDHAAVFQSMGQTGYLSALKWACAVAGNSSSGIIEAPSFHIPTINIGDRQRGRISGASVIHCGNEAGEIRKAFQTALSEEFVQKCRLYQNPYEGENTCGRILEEIKKALTEGICLQKKFYRPEEWI